MPICLPCLLLIIDPKGTPNLYDMDIELASPKNGASSLQITKRVGFRTIVLNLEPYIDRWGSNFHFEVNGQPFNAKGKSSLQAVVQSDVL